MANNLTLAVHVTPRASRDEIVGVHVDQDGQREVSLRVTAPPDAGKANKAVCKLVAKELCIPKSLVVVKRGEAARHKLLTLEVSEADLEAWLGSLSTD